jgi:hypothetical protein
MAEKIFINYRSDDSIAAIRLHDRLAQTFGRRNLVMDVAFRPGSDFLVDLTRQVIACDLVLVVIGSTWLDAKDETGKRRLDNPHDFVVIEIEAALARDIHVIPVLVEGARMPGKDELPDSLKRLARRQAVEIRDASFDRDVEALVSRISRRFSSVSGKTKRGQAFSSKCGKGQDCGRAETLPGVAAEQETFDRQDGELCRGR